MRFLKSALLVANRRRSMMYNLGALDLK